MKLQTKLTNNVYILSFVATVGGSLFGFDISSMSAWIGTDQYNNYFNSPNSELQGGITASMSAGSFAGALAAGFLSDRIGRKHSIQVAAVIWIIGSMVTCSSQNVVQLVAGRVINGLSVGINSSQVPVYLAEIAPKRYRGRVVAIQQWAIEWGILIMYFLSYGCSQISGPTSFRLAWSLQAVPALFLLIALVPFPLSPRWLAYKERYDEALEVIANIHGAGDKTSPAVEAEFNDVKQAAEEAKSVKWHMLFGRKMWRRTLVGCFTQIWQQLTGGNVLMYYIVYVFYMAGLTGNANLVSSSIQYVIFVAMNVPAMIFIDVWGRRSMLLWGSAGMGAFNFIVGALLATHGHAVDSVDGNSNVTWTLVGNSPSKAVIACSYLFIAIYGLTWAPAAWVYISEIWPQGYRAKGVGLCAASNWAFNFALAFFVPPALKNIQWKTYMIFGTFCVVMGIHVFFMWPETRQMSLEEIDILFDGKVPAWKSSTIQSRFDQEVEEIRRRRNEKVAPGSGDVPKESTSGENLHLEREDTSV